MTPPPHRSPSEPTLSRRRFLVATAGVAATAALTACGDDDDAADAADAATGATSEATGGTQATAATGATDATDGAASSGFPVEIAGLLGTTTLERAPVRVVAVGQYRDLDAAVALGVVPLASPDLSFFLDGGVAPWVLPLLGGEPPELVEVDPLPYERIAALEPDLILATDRSALDEEWSTLIEIAPTLSFLNGYNEDPWQLTLTRIGTALGRADRATELVAEVEAAVAAARSANPQFAGRTFTFGPVSAEGQITTINSTTDASVVFLAALGLELSPAVLDLPQAMFPGRAEISPERLDLLDADVVLLTFTSPEVRAELEANPLFQALPAVQRGSYVALDLPIALAMAFPSALSIPYGLDQLVPELVAAVY